MAVVLERASVNKIGAGQEANTSRALYTRARTGGHEEVVETCITLYNASCWEKKDFKHALNVQTIYCFSPFNIQIAYKQTTCMCSGAAFLKVWTRRNGRNGVSADCQPGASRTSHACICLSSPCIDPQDRTACRTTPGTCLRSLLRPWLRRSMVQFDFMTRRLFDQITRHCRE